LRGLSLLNILTPIMVFYKGDDAHNGDDNDAFYDVRMAVVAEA